MAKLNWSKASNSAAKSSRWDKVDYKTKPDLVDKRKKSSSTRVEANNRKLRIVNEWVREVMLIDPTVTYKECLAAGLKYYEREQYKERDKDFKPYTGNNRLNNYEYFTSQRRKQS